MRPARKGPENVGARAREDAEIMPFNEAGPQGAGKPIWSSNSRMRVMSPSMRPARKGPENQLQPFLLDSPPVAFNEAGPQGAGKLATAAPSATWRARLQ